jgi:hypothetical protein
MFTNIFEDELVNESRQNLTEARIDTSPYESINDETPNGKGTWTFTIDTYPDHPSDYGKLEKSGMIVDYTDDYKVAEKKVQQAFPSARIIYLLP